MIKNFLSEFKSFAIRGNVVDLAIAVVMGAAFGKIVDSLVKNIIMPFIGGLSGGIDLTGLKYSFVSEVTRKSVDLNYGIFLQSVFDFLIVTLAIFISIKVANAFKHHAESTVEIVPPSEPTAEVKLLTEIRDLLRK